MTRRYFSEENRLVLELLGAHTHGDERSPDVLVSVYRATQGVYSCYLVRGYFKAVSIDKMLEARVHATDLHIEREDDAWKKADETFEWLGTERKALLPSRLTSGSAK